jgi:hypothetical protein
MNKRSIPKIKEKLQKMDKMLSYIHETLAYINSTDVKQFRGQEKCEILESLDNAENEIVFNLWDIIKLSETTIKHIDPESWRELQDEK